jgi:ribonuclease T2
MITRAIFFAAVLAAGLPAQADEGRFHILALSWQPAFCEKRPDKTECKAQTVEAYEASNFALHGLWPQPRRNVYCAVRDDVIAADEEGEWFSLPETDLSPETKAALDRVMPGTRSLLDRHEWIKHGTCYGSDAEQYYKDSIRLTQAVNASPVGALMASRVGKRISTAELRAAFDEALGEGAGLRVRVNCERDGGRLLISEITIGLKGDIAGGATLRELVMAAPPTSQGCPGGIVDPVGRQ